MRKKLLLLFLLTAGGGVILFFCLFLSSIPGKLLAGWQKQLTDYDIHVNWKNADWKLPFVFTWEDFSFTTGKKHDFPSLHAKRLRVIFHTSRIFRGILFPFSLQMDDGVLSIPLFPENAGEKEPAPEDKLTVSNLQLALRGVPGEIRVHNFSGRIGKGEFIFSGTIDNLLHTLAASLFGSLRHELLENDPAPRKRDIKETLKGLFSFQLPLEARRDLNAYRLAFQKENGSLPILLHCKFFLDCKNYVRNYMEGVFHMEPFSFRKVPFQTFQGKFTLAGGVFKLPEVTLRTAGKDHFTFSGRYDGKKDLASGSFYGKADLETGRKFLPVSRQKELEKLPLSPNGSFQFSGNVASWKIGEPHSLNGQLAVDLPPLNGPGSIRISGGKLDMQVKNGILEGKIASREIRKDSLTGNALLDFRRERKGDWLFSLSGKIPLSFLGSSPAFQQYFPQKLSFDPREKLAFSLRYSSFSDSRKAPLGVLAFSLPQLQYERLPVRDIQGELEIRGDLLYFRKLRGRQGNMLLSFAGEALLPEKTFRGNIKLTGSPGKEGIQFLASRGGSAGKYLLTHLDFPQKGDLAEVAGTFFFRGGKGKEPPFWYWDGTLVMENFSWQKVPYSYFAGRIIADSHFNGAVQGGTLQSKNGEAVFSLLYDPGKNETDGNVQWELKSRLSGNEVLKSIWPDAAVGEFNFPHPVYLALAGRTYLTGSGKDHFRGTVTNSSFYWRDLLFSRMDALMEYKKDTLYINNASGKVAEGRIHFDYSYDFSTDNGNLKLQLENGRLTTLLKTLQADFEGVNTSDAKLTSSLETRISFPKNSSTATLQGKGKAVILGDDLWKIPLFGEILNFLGKSWNTNKLGSITRVDADFSFAGTKFVADKIRSNGSVVGIQMSGYYDWVADDLDFRIRSELLRGTLPFEAMSKVLSPVSWILERRLRGKGKEHKWEWFVIE